jgi:predicted DNA-binding transcriptional regulator YafY
MRAVRSTGKRFEPEDEFDIDAEMSRGIGVHNTGREEKVRLRFTGVSAQLIAERHWHGTQQLQSNGDGSLELTLSVVPSPELDHWLFRWEDEVEVLEPGSLKEAMREKLRRMAATI